MRTSGTLGVDSFGDVLLELEAEQVTGILKIQATARDGEAHALKLMFSAGGIYQVDSPTRPEPWRLGKLLIRGELISQADLDAALERAQLRDQPLGAMLVAQRKLTADQLEEVLYMQFVEDLHRAVEWSQGAWRFKEGPVALRPGGPEPLEPRHLVVRGRMQAERWPALRLMVPDEGVRFVKKVRGPITEEQARKHHLEAQELKLFSLVHKSRKVSDLVVLARLETFEVFRSLALLAQGGFIAADPATLTVKPVAAVGGERSLKQSAAFHVFTAVLLVACLAVGVGVFLKIRAQGVEETTQEQEEGVVAAATIDPWRAALTRAQLGRIRTALEVHHQRRGDYPARLEILVEEGLLSEADLSYPDYERSYTYRPKGEGYRLSQPKK